MDWEFCEQATGIWEFCGGLEAVVGKLDFYSRGERVERVGRGFIVSVGSKVPVLPTFHPTVHLGPLKSGPERYQA